MKNYTREEIDEMNQARVKQAKEEYEKFLSKFEVGECYICGEKLDKFDEKKPCLHWLLYPKNIKKKFFKDFFSKFDLFQVNSYLMWVSYQDKNHFANINNLSLEKDENKIWEVTIKYQNLHWAISCSNTDFLGHKEKEANFPHYHFLMGVDDKPFISFNDFHIPLTKDDKLRMVAHNKPLGKFIHFWYIPGVEEMFNIGPKEMLKHMRTAKDEEEAPFDLSGMFEIDGSISGEDITDALLRSKKTGESMIKCLSEIPNIKMTTIIQPGKGVPELDRKLSRGKKKNENKNKQN